MSALLKAREPSAKYIVKREAPLARHFELLATAPSGVTRLRELILTLAVRGKLVPQDPGDEPADVLLKEIRAERERLSEEGQTPQSTPVELGESGTPFELPGGWQWASCAQYFLALCTGPFGSIVHREDYVRNGVPLINPSHMIEGRIVHDPCVTLSPQKAQDLSAYALRTGDIVLARRGEVGRYALVTGQEDGWLCGTGSFYVRLHPSCNREYLGLVFRDKRFREYLLGESVGTTMTNLNQRILLQALLAIPPLAEQSRIVARVEELMRLCDALEAKGRLEATQHRQLVTTLLGTLTDSESSEALADRWQRIAEHFDILLDRPEAVDALEQTILQLAVRGLLVPQDPVDEPASVLLSGIEAERSGTRTKAKGRSEASQPPSVQKSFALPKNWEWVTLGQIAESRLGKMLDKAKNSGKRFPYLRNTNVQWRRIELDDVKEISLEPHELDEFRLMPGDLLICEGGYPGRCAIWNEPAREMYFQKALHRVRPLGGVLPELLAISLECDSRAGDLDRYFTGATIKHFVGQALERYVIGLPPLAEQARIVARVDELRRLCTDLRQRLAAAQATQAQLAEALVAQPAP